MSRAEENYQTLVKWGGRGGAAGHHPSDKPFSKFMEIYAAMCRLHMKTYGTTQRQIAAVSAKNHTHSVHNPFSQFRKPFTVEEILAPPITYPITLPMCAPYPTEPAAAIVCTGRASSASVRTASRCIRVAASVLRSFSHRGIDQPELSVGHLAARQAYEQAGLGRRICRLPRCMTPPPWAKYCRRKTWGLSPSAMAARRRNAVNLPWAAASPSTSGGLESKGHPLGPRYRPAL